MLRNSRKQSQTKNATSALCGGVVFKVLWLINLVVHCCVVSFVKGHKPPSHFVVWIHHHLLSSQLTMQAHSQALHRTTFHAKPLTTRRAVRTAAVKVSCGVLVGGKTPTHALLLLSTACPVTLVCTTHNNPPSRLHISCVVTRRQGACCWGHRRRGAAGHSQIARGECMCGCVCCGSVYTSQFQSPKCHADDQRPSRNTVDIIALLLQEQQENALCIGGQDSSPAL